jgi:hypothetical protein
LTNIVKCKKRENLCEKNFSTKKRFIIPLNQIRNEFVPLKFQAPKAKILTFTSGFSDWEKQCPYL